jgi:hypothetical protein
MLQYSPSGTPLQVPRDVAVSVGVLPMIIRSHLTLALHCTSYVHLTTKSKTAEKYITQFDMMCISETKRRMSHGTIRFSHDYDSHYGQSTASVV